MKSLFALVLAIAGMSSQSAMAAQYQIYITNSTHVSTSQADLSSIVQKEINIDTTAKTLTINLTPVCAETFCPHYMSVNFVRVISLPVTDVQFANGNLTSVTATGPIALDGKQVVTTMQIRMNADNATDINVVSGSPTNLERSSFVGASAKEVDAE